MIVIPTNKVKINEVVGEAEEYLGDEFYDCISKHSKNNILHPILVMKNDLSSLTNEYEGESIIRYRFKAIEYIELCSYINLCKNIDGIDETIKLLKDKNSYYGGFYELYIASVYISKSYSVEMIKKEPNTIGKINEFKVFTEKGLINIECKSIDDWGAKEALLWKKLIKDIFVYTKKINKYFIVEINSNSKISGNDTEKILQVIKRNAKDLRLDNMFIIREGLSLNIKISKEIYVTTELSPQDYLQSIFENINLKYNQGASEQSVQQQIHNNGSKRLHVTDRNIVNIKLNNTKEFKKKILDKIREAKKQLPNDYPGVVYINIPVKEGEDFMDIIDNNYDDVFHKINRTGGSGKVHSVILTSKLLLKDNNDSPLELYSNIIPNYNCKFQLPDDFELYSPKTLEQIDIKDQQ